MSLRPTYQIIARGDGESWWTYYHASGTDVEQVQLRGLPSCDLQVEVITPPQFDGGPEAPYDWVPQLRD